jgi:transcription antitermination factor NusA-like protein
MIALGHQRVVNGASLFGHAQTAPVDMFIGRRGRINAMVITRFHGQNVDRIARSPYQELF